MFGLRSPTSKSLNDPLQSRRTAMAWFGQLPTLDVMARATQATQALDALRESAAALDRDRVAAIGYLDAVVESDMHRLIAWYLDNHEKSPALADRFWTAAHDLNKAFTQIYQAAVDSACAALEDPRWRPVLPLLIAELIRSLGIDARLRLFHRQRWIPAKWSALHALFRRATDLAIERLAATPDSTDPLAPERTIEQEYLYVLLIHQLDTGNLTPAELEWASMELLAWSRDLSLDAVAWASEGFYVDLRGSAGLIRRTGNDQGKMVGYLDTAVLVRQLDASLAKLMQPSPDAAAEDVALRQQHIETLEKLRPTIVPTKASEYRRQARNAMHVPAMVAIGLPEICAAIGEADAADAAADGQTQGMQLSGPHRKHFAALRYEEGEADSGDAATAAPTDAPGVEPAAPGISGARSPQTDLARSTAEPIWRIKDMSAAGWRMAAPASVGSNLALGTLVAARMAGKPHFMLGLVRRMNEPRKGEIDAGVSLVADRVLGTTLYAKRHATEEWSFVVDGVDTATVGARFHGLYLPPPADVGFPISMRTLIVPTPEYAEGRRLVLVTGRSDYLVVLRHLVDRRIEWCWTTMQVAARIPPAS